MGKLGQDVNETTVVYLDGTYSPSNLKGLFVQTLHTLIPIKATTLRWEIDPELVAAGVCSGLLTLNDIRRQLEEWGYMGTYYVWTENANSGAIYQYGNYTEREWVLYGETLGFA